MYAGRKRRAHRSLALSLLLWCSPWFFMESSYASQEDAAESGDVAGNCAIRSITPGVIVNGALTSTDCFSQEGPYYTQVFAFNGQTGQRISIILTSRAFDAYLMLIGPDGKVVAEDDDGGGGTNARIPALGALTLTRSGLFRIEVSTFRYRQTGSYSLLLDTSGQSPVVVEPPAAALTSGGPYRFVPIIPCRVMDTRAGGGKSGSFGPPLLVGGTVRNVPVRLAGCDALTGAVAYSLNITVIPRRQLAYLVAYPGNQAQPNSSTLNSFDGRIVANAAIVPGGADGSVSLFSTDDTDVVVDINGYLVP